MQRGAKKGWYILCIGNSPTATGSPRNLRVFDETISTMRLSWEAAPGSVVQYRVAYKAAEGMGERKEVGVKGDTTTLQLKNLDPATEYELFVSARYSSGLGNPLLGKGTTLEGKGTFAVESLLYQYISGFGLVSRF